jgi:phage-related protein
MFDSVRNFFGRARTFFGNVYDKAKQVVSDIIHTPGRVVQAIHQDATDVLKSVKETVIHVVDKSSDTANHIITGAQSVIQTGQQTIGNTVNHVSDSLSMPLVLLAGGLGLFMLTKK